MAASKNSGLQRYRSKRSPNRTPEPFTGSTSGVRGQRFVVQQHAATRLHYDFRLELDGVLKSWAVPKGPSPNPKDKRLAVQTEDHPLDYADFEGRIPPGNYGAGSVIVWDRGNWQPLADDPLAALAAGKLAFELNGYKLRGRWALVKTKRSETDWLLIKELDGYVEEQDTSMYPPDSILSGLTVSQLAENYEPARALIANLNKRGVARKPLRAKGLKPMLASAGKAFDDPAWVFEFKYDGYRLLVEKSADSVVLLSRNGHDLTGTFPDIAGTLEYLPYPRLLMDGEAIVHDKNGLPSFALLQKRGRLAKPREVQQMAIRLPATLYVFDLLAIDEFDLRDLPLIERKALLREVLPTVGPLRYSEHIEEHGLALYEQARNMRLEGIVAKRSNSKYQSGRSKDWQKISLKRRDDFVIAGYTDPKGSQQGFGALLLGQYSEGTLVFTGRVGSGFSQELLRSLSVTLSKLPGAPAPSNVPADVKGCWVQPSLVCEVQFKQVTSDGLLRAPVFLRLRDDKRPEECVGSYVDVDRNQADIIAGTDDRENDGLRLTHLEKVFWPKEGYRKGDLIDYYRTISPHMLPYLKDRPIVLTRFPDGIEGKSFYQKDAPGYVPEWLRIENIWSESSGRDIGYFVIDSVEALLYVVNMGSIPIHCWLSRTQHLEQPDWCVLDLDPKNAPFKNVVTIAKAIHKLCDTIGLPNFIKTSGSTGLHILVPLAAKYTYDQSRSLAELLANIIVQQLPDIATVTRNPAKRENKVYIDYLQNRHGQTIAAPFCIRPLPCAPVSMPIAWREVNSKLHNQRFTMSNAAKRTRSLKRDPWRGLTSVQVDLPSALDRLAEKLS